MTASFLTSAAEVAGLPQFDSPEFALAGRSNVGKSSLLGLLLRRSKLVRTSKTPGRTRLLNAFAYGDEFTFVDLPGYGYAKVSKTERRFLGRLVSQYLEGRETLRGVLLILDARRTDVMQIDKDAVEVILEAGRPLLLVVTKIDLIPKNRRIGTLRSIERSLGVPLGSAVPCSSKTGEGRDEIFRRLRELAAVGAK